MKIPSVKENYIFRRAYRKGKCYVFPELVLYVLKTKRDFPRLGITVTKKQGNAPARNRIRRVVRAGFAAQREILPRADIIAVARSRSVQMKSTDVELLLQKAFGAPKP